MISIAHAAGEAGPAGGIVSFLPMIILFAIFYFLLIRPQQKKAKEHREMVASLKKGERVVTSGGIYGTITSLDETTVGLEVADKVKIKVGRGNIAMLVSGSEPAAKQSQKEDKK